MTETVRRFPVPPPETDPVLAALIARLPAAGTVWPAKKRQAWMQLMWGAFELVYDADGDALDLPAFLNGAPVSLLSESVHAPPSMATPVPRPVASPYAFLIDKEGFARRGDRTRILPADVAGVIYDERGEGDFTSIIWADDSRGVKGLTLDISPAF